jgi:hypothetical protein
MKETRKKDDTQKVLRHRGPGQCLFVALVFCVMLFIHGGAQALDVPPLKGRVNDYAGMISPGVRAQLEMELKDFEQSDSTQIVILTIESLEGESLEEFSIKVAETWKIGQKGKDNGAILLVAKKDRKTRIEVGRGLEGKLTDLTAGRIVQLVINRGRPGRPVFHPPCLFSFSAPYSSSFWEGYPASWAAGPVCSAFRRLGSCWGFRW